MTKEEAASLRPGDKVLVEANVEKVWSTTDGKLYVTIGIYGYDDSENYEPAEIIRKVNSDA